MIKYSKIALKSPFMLPYRFTGSTVRGAFGVGLKKTVCINPSGNCEGCFAKEGCLFYDFFESDNPKYRLKTDLSGNVSFELFLFEEYADKSPYVIRALYTAFKKTGIGRKREKIDFKLYLNDEMIYNGNEFSDFKNTALEFEAEEIKTDCEIYFITPLRIKENGMLQKRDVSFETVLRTVYHRLHKLQNLPVTKIPFTPQYNISEKEFSFIDLKRYSNRQKTGMNFGGLMGRMKFEHIDEKSYYLLKIGELIGVGKQTTFGLGNMKVV